MSTLEPRTRFEKFLAKIAGDTISISPITRLEKFLAKIAGDSVEVTPVTRMENFLKDVADNVSGGGSSDFSAAEVTIINQATMSLSNVPATVCYEENDLGDGVPATLFPSIISIPSSQTGSIKCALYKGTSAIMFADYTEFVEISVSGDATYMGGMVAVTGDCTITITEKQ